MCACSLGTCERYQRLSSICNTVFNESTGYVFIRNSSGLFNQSWLSYKLDQILSDTIIDGNTTCSLMIKSVVCNYFMPTCGNSGFVHIPRAVCPNDCSLVQNGCSDEWSRINTVLVVNGNLGAINCEATQHLLNPLPTCCIEIPEINVQGDGHMYIYIIINTTIYCTCRYHNILRGGYYASSK